MLKTEKDILKEIRQSLEDTDIIGCFEDARTGALNYIQFFKDLGVELTDAQDD